MTSQPAAPRPNIILIHCDELRFPVHFPAGIENADQFLAKFMQYTYSLLWRDGVKFVNHQIASCACSPSRAVIATGLYSQQTYLMATRANFANAQSPRAPQPELQTAFPTYGKLMRELGYDTPYVGKAHWSNSGFDPGLPTAYRYLDDYGFDALTVPDPVGLPGQGVGAVPADNQYSQPVGDSMIASQAIAWLKKRAGEDNPKPFCLTIGLVNPHDLQFFWAGIEANTFNALYATKTDGTQGPAMVYQDTVVVEVNPPSYGYSLPGNWESAQRLEESGPKLHRVAREFFSYQMTGGFSDDPNQTDFTMVDSLSAQGMKTAVAPFSYWIKGLNSYTKMMQLVDEQIGQVVVNIPPEILRNSVILFTSDHGDYAGSHGMMGKGYALYKEGLQVPLAVRDHTGSIAKAPELQRQQLTSHVDLLALLVSIGQGGTGWMDQGPYATLYGKRARLYDILKDPKAPGRRHALHATDEPMNVANNYLDAPTHVVGVITEQGKLGSYALWDAETNGSTPLPEGMQVEFYDYSTPGGVAELNSTPEQPEAKALLKLLLDDLIPNELQAPLPEQYQDAQKTALDQYWRFIKLTDAAGIIAGLTS